KIPLPRDCDRLGWHAPVDLCADPSVRSAYAGAQVPAIPVYGSRASLPGALGLPQCDGRSKNARDVPSRVSVPLTAIQPWALMLTAPSSCTTAASGSVESIRDFRANIVPFT